VQVEYTIEYETLSSLKVGIYTSPDGASKGTLLKTETITDSSKLSVGSVHSVEFTDILDGFTDSQQGYYLIAVLDPDDSIEEYDEQDNIAILEGGLHYDPASRVLYVFGGSGDDDVGFEYSSQGQLEVGISFWTEGGLQSQAFSGPASSVSSVHIRLYGGRDTMDGAYNPAQSQFSSSLLPVPLWVFAGDGDDWIQGGTVADYLDGQGGNDYLAGSLGDDIVHGGAGTDSLYGDIFWSYLDSVQGPTWPNAGLDTLFGDADVDTLVGDYGTRFLNAFGQSANPKPYTAGNDTLDGGNSSDDLYGEAGATTIAFGPASTDGVLDDVFAEAGGDGPLTFAWNGGTGRAQANLSGSLLTLVASGSGQLALGRAGTVDTVTKNGSGTIDITTLTSSAGPPRFDNNAGTTRFMTDLAATAAAGPTVNVNNGSRVEFHTTQHLAALNIAAYSTAQVAPSTAPNYKALVVKALNITTYGVLDVANNGLIIDFESGASPETQVRNWLVAGRGGVGIGEGTWDGWGITSSTAAAINQTDMESRSVGYGVNLKLPLGSLTTFMGQSVDDTSLLIRFTITADLDLNGTVNEDDTTVQGAYYGTVSTGEWITGDLDYDGDVDDDDATLLGAFYGQSI
jgi:hypothetical protein